MADDEIELWPTPGWWKKLAAKALRESGRGTKTRVADQLGCHPSSINKMLSPESRTSSHAMEFSRLLGIVPPVNVVSRELEEWDRIGEELTPEQRRMVLDFIRSMAK